MGSVPTVRVRRKSDGAECVINVSDYKETPRAYEKLSAPAESEGRYGGEPSSGGKESSSGEKSLGVKSYGLAELRVAEAAELIAVAELGELAALEAEERAGKSRKGVFAALDKRREELQGSEG